LRTGKLVKFKDTLNMMSFYFFTQVNHDSTGKLTINFGG